MASMSWPDVESAIRLAVIGQQAVEALTGAQRLDLLEKAGKYIAKHREEFVKSLVEEAGKLARDAEGEVDATLERLRLTALDARAMFGTYIPSGWTYDTKGRAALVQRVPLGVVAIISPFNYPLFIPAAKAIPALVAGNSVVMKPASATPTPMLLFAEAIEAAGFPRGTFSIVTGSGGLVGNLLVKSPAISMIAFTGSAEVGLGITQQAGIKKLQLELGGKGVAIVLPDADRELAATEIAEGALKNAGQRCDAVSLVIAVGTEILTDMIEERVRDWTENHEPQRLISLEAAKFVRGLIDDAVFSGAHLKIGGRGSGTYIEPAVLDRVPRTARIIREETFGPVIPIIHLSEDEAVELHNSLPVGLDSSIFTKDLAHGLALAKKLQTGSVTINAAPKHGLGLFPYGGVKASGIGREGIGYTIEEMSTLKTIVVPE